MNETVRFINLGSGQRRFTHDWINVDSNPRWQPDVTQDGLEYLKGLPDQSIETICLHHVLEHFGCNEADGLLKEAWRTLQRGGSLLVFVPDLRALASLWAKGTLDDETYIINLYGAYMGDEADRHKWGFTKETLTRTLANAGFRWAGGFDWRAIEGADIARADWILGIEATK